MKLYAAVIVTLALGVIAPSASAQTPAGYRAQLNGLCRGYTPKFRADRKALQKATKAKDWKAFGYALGHYLALALAQDRQIESTPVPAAMRTQMTPILRLLRTADGHARLALHEAAMGDSRGRLPSSTRPASSPSLSMVDSTGRSPRLRLQPELRKGRRPDSKVRKPSLRVKCSSS